MDNFVLSLEPSLRAVMWKSFKNKTISLLWICDGHIPACVAVNKEKQYS